MDYYTYMERGDKNCGCRISDEDPVVVAQSADADCYKITAPYECVGRGIAGSDVHWFNTTDARWPFDNRHKCFLAVMAEPICDKTWLTWNARSDQGCGCIKYKSPRDDFVVQVSDCSDYCEIKTPVCDHSYCDWTTTTTTCHTTTTTCDTTTTTTCHTTTTTCIT